MQCSKIQLGASCVALAISLALAGDWLVRSEGGFGWSLARASLLLVCVGSSAAVIAAVAQRWQAADRAARSELEMLCRAEIRELVDAAGNESFTHTSADPRWAGILQRVRERLVEVAGRLRELEGQRNTIESRARRNEAQSERMQWIFSGLAEPVLAIDKYDELVLANPSAQTLLAIDEVKTEERALAKVVHCEKLVELLTDTRKRKAPSQRTCEVELTGAPGSSTWYRATARSVPSQGDQPADGGSQGAVAVLHDISSQKALQKRNAEFVSSVSHEMKAPLAGIKAYVELLVDGDAEDDATREQFLEIINAQADRLQRLVDNLLNIARIEAGVVQVKKQGRSLNEVLEKALQVMRPAAEAKQIDLSADLSPLYLGVYLDHDLALQAAINLVSNAVKYTPVGGHVTLRSRLADDEVRFDVEDNGVGLSAEDCVRVFEKFYRVHKDKDLAAGTGLGLPLVKHIIEDVHGGRLAVQSTPGKGSVFSAFLPTAATLT